MAAGCDARLQRRVLIIDDEPQILRMLAALLAAHGYRTRVARDGCEGLAAAAQCQSDVIIVDLGPPDIDGIELIKSLRMSTQIPVIVLSGRSKESDKVRPGRHGAGRLV